MSDKLEPVTDADVREVFVLAEHAQSLAETLAKRMMRHATPEITQPAHAAGVALDVATSFAKLARQLAFVAAFAERDADISSISARKAAEVFLGRKLSDHD